MALTERFRRGVRGCAAALGAAFLGVIVAGFTPAIAQQPSLDGDPAQLDQGGPGSSIEARNALARAGYLPNLNGFQNALEAGDTAAIPFYQAAGFELSGDTIRGYVNPMYGHSDRFDPSVAGLLVNGGVDRKAFCIDPSGTWDHYFVAERGLDRIAAREDFLRGLCGGDDMVLAIGALLNAEALQLSAKSLANEARPNEVDACVEAYAAAHSVEDILAEAEDYSLFGVERVTPPHDTVMMELSSWHLSGQKTDAEDAFSEAVMNGCRAAIPAHVISTAYHDKLVAVLAVLRPDEAAALTGEEG